MSVFFLPDGSPFYEGTYFPPESAYNRPGFKELLTAITEHGEGAFDLWTQEEIVRELGV